jgi:hypothetical protein
VICLAHSSSSFSQGGSIRQGSTFPRRMSGIFNGTQYRRPQASQKEVATYEFSSKDHFKMYDTRGKKSTQTSTYLLSAPPAAGVMCGVNNEERSDFNVGPRTRSYSTLRSEVHRSPQARPNSWSADQATSSTVSVVVIDTRTSPLCLSLGSILLQQSN